MMHASQTQYSSLPAMPTISALPGGIPSGPWGPLYQSAPGATIPAVRYPGMAGAGFGQAPVQLLGAFGQGMAGKAAGIVVNAGMAALSAGILAWAVNSTRPIRNTAALSGGAALLTGLYYMSKNGAA